MTVFEGASLEELRECAEMMARTEPWTTLRRSFDQCLAGISHEDARVLLTRANGSILGFLVYNMRVGVFRGYIQTLCVSESARGKGMGADLIREAEQRIFKESPNVFICVSAFNSRARSLYECLGYTLVGEFPDLIVEGHSELLLRKTTGPLTEFVHAPS